MARLEAWRRDGKLTKDIGELKQDLDREKRDFFRRMTGKVAESAGSGSKRMDLGIMAGMYRDMLSKVRLAISRARRKLTRKILARDVPDETRSQPWLHQIRPDRGKRQVFVRLLSPRGPSRVVPNTPIDVWDTVGSLGLPRMQWGLSSVARNDGEVGCFPPRSIWQTELT